MGSTSLIVLILLFNSIQEFQSKSSKPQLLFDWTEIDFVFHSNVMRLDYLDSGQFIPENNAISQLKIHKNHIFVNIPRHFKGIPSTLNYIYYNSKIMTNSSKNVPLIPFPNWKWQGISRSSKVSRNCEKSLKNVETFDIDEYDRLWVFDSGFDLSQDQKASVQCPFKILVIDLIQNKILRIFTFKNEKQQKKKKLKLKKPTGVSNLVVNCSSIKKCSAYMSLNGQIVVFNYEKNYGRVFQMPKLNEEITTNKNYPFEFNSYGSSDRHLHPNRFVKEINHDGEMNIKNLALFDQKLYLTYENKHKIYWIPVNALNLNENLNIFELQMPEFDNLMPINSMDIDPNGLLYCTHSNGSEIEIFDIKSGRIMGEIPGDFSSIGAFAFDRNGLVYFTDKTEGNFKIYKSFY